MRGMILAAGLGKRMGALTEKTPKPLLKAGNRCLIEYAIDAMRSMDINEIVINISYLGEQIKHALGDGSRYGVALMYSEEKEPLETGGGIFQALPLLGPGSFMVISSDIISEYPFAKLNKNPEKLAHLIMVDNPKYNAKGDFSLQGTQLSRGQETTLTYSSMGILRPELFHGCKPGKFRLGDLLYQAADAGQLTGEHYRGKWFNVGTPEELAGFANS